MKKFVHFLVLLMIVIPVVGITAQQSIRIPSPATADVMKMANAKVGDDVLIAYVQNSTVSFHLSADDIIALKNAAVGSSVIQAMLNHDTAAAAESPSPPSQTTALNPDPAAYPPIIEEVVPIGPGPGYEWIPGYWSWQDHWVWVYGTWRPYRSAWRHRRY
jgi:hypothetical protein